MTVSTCQLIFRDIRIDLGNTCCPIVELDRVRANLHVVLCFSPVGDAFRTRCRRFPGLINCTQIDWFRAWPRDALVKVSLWFLEDVDVGDVEVGGLNLWTLSLGLKFYIVLIDLGESQTTRGDGIIRCAGPQGDFREFLRDSKVVRAVCTLLSSSNPWYTYLVLVEWV